MLESKRQVANSRRRRCLLQFQSKMTESLTGNGLRHTQKRIPETSGELPWYRGFAALLLACSLSSLSRKRICNWFQCDCQHVFEDIRNITLDLPRAIMTKNAGKGAAWRRLHTWSGRTRGNSRTRTRSHCDSYHHAKQLSS
jgi:hypothetical protein